jgi:hypothetical protein
VSTHAQQAAHRQSAAMPGGLSWRRAWQAAHYGIKSIAEVLPQPDETIKQIDNVCFNDNTFTSYCWDCNEDTHPIVSVRAGVQVNSRDLVAMKAFPDLSWKVIFGTTTVQSSNRHLKLRVCGHPIRIRAPSFARQLFIK